MHEREFDHAQATSDPATRDSDLAPGHSNRAAQLVAPTRPLVSGLLQRKARDSNGVVDDAEQAVASASASSGATLPGPIQRKFESSLGADLSSVRVHTGAESQAAASAVGAKAYTIGQDIHFGAGHYDPASTTGEHLLAHEVAHTVQQSASARRVAQFKLEVSHVGDALEIEADRAAESMVRGQSASLPSTGSGLVRKTVQRDPMSEDEYVTGQVAAAENETKAQINRTQVSTGAAFTIDKNHKDELKQKAAMVDGWTKAMDEQTQMKLGSAMTHGGAGSDITPDKISDNVRAAIKLREYAAQVDNEQSDMTAIRSGYAVLTVDYTRAIATLNSSAAMYGIDLKKSGGDGTRAAKQMVDGMGVDKADSAKLIPPNETEALTKLANDYNSSVRTCRSLALKVKAQSAAMKGATARFRVHTLAKDIKDKTAELNEARAQEAQVKGVVSTITTAALAACGAESLVALEMPNPTLAGAEGQAKGLASKGAKFMLDDVKDNVIDAPISGAVTSLQGLRDKINNLTVALGKLQGEKEAEGDVAAAKDVEAQGSLLESALTEFDKERVRADNMKLQLRDGWAKLGKAMDKNAGGNSQRYTLLAKTVGECDAFFGQAQKVYDEIGEWESSHKKTNDMREGINTDTKSNGFELGLKAWEFILANPSERLYGLIEHPIILQSSSLNSNAGQDPISRTKQMKAEIRTYGKTLLDYRNHIVQNALGTNVPFPELAFLKSSDGAE